VAQTGQGAKRNRRRKAAPVLGAAGLTLTLASAAVAARPADDPVRQTAARQVTLAEEEITDVSLATFRVIDNEKPGTTRAGPRFAMSACGGCAGCGGCGGCWTGTYYEGSMFGNGAAAPHHPSKPAHKRTHARSKARTNKSPKP